MTVNCSFLTYHLIPKEIVCSKPINFNTRPPKINISLLLFSDAVSRDPCSNPILHFRMYQVKFLLPPGNQCLIRNIKSQMLQATRLTDFLRLDITNSIYYSGKENFLRTKEDIKNEPHLKETRFSAQTEEVECNGVILPFPFNLSETVTTHQWETEERNIQVIYYCWFLFIQLRHVFFFQHCVEFRKTETFPRCA